MSRANSSKGERRKGKGESEESEVNEQGGKENASTRGHILIRTESSPTAQITLSTPFSVSLYRIIE